MQELRSPALGVLAAAVVRLGGADVLVAGELLHAPDVGAGVYY